MCCISNYKLFMLLKKQNPALCVAENMGCRDEIIISKSHFANLDQEGVRRAAKIKVRWNWDVVVFLQMQTVEQQERRRQPRARTPCFQKLCTTLLKGLNQSLMIL